MTSRTESRHVSPWVDTMREPPLESAQLTEANGADVLVLGAGVVGLTTALLLQRSGRRVALLEARDLSASVTAHSTVKVTVGHGTTYSAIARARDEEAAAAYAEANRAGLVTILDLADGLDLDCDLRTGRRHVVYAEDDGDVPRIEEELDLARRLALPVSVPDDPGLPFPVAAAMAFDDEATLHPARYLQGLAEAFVREGGTLVTGVAATGVRESSDSCRVATTEGEVGAVDVVVATGYPILDRGGHFTRLTATRAYGVAGVLPDGVGAGMTIDTGPATRSTRTADLDGERLLVVVGEGHEVGHLTDTGQRWERLRRWATERFGVTDFRYHWSAEEMRSFDLVPFAGRIAPGSDHVYTATGFAGWGMTNGTASATVIADLVRGESPPAWAGAFDARRAETTMPDRDFVEQNLHATRTWVRDRFGRASSEPLETLEAGDGEVRRVDGKDTAVYRDEAGDLHAVSAACTHLGCNVAWNAGERSWDCPCHGSRFSVDGEVLHGPASRPLRKRRLGEGR